MTNNEEGEAVGNWDRPFSPGREFENAMRQTRRGLHEGHAILELDVYREANMSARPAIELQQRALLAVRTAVTRIATRDLTEAFVKALEDAIEGP